VPDISASCFRSIGFLGNASGYAARFERRPWAAIEDHALTYNPEQRFLAGSNDHLPAMKDSSQATMRQRCDLYFNNLSHALIRSLTELLRRRRTLRKDEILAVPTGAPKTPLFYDNSCMSG
jgi:hypothetical protein